MRTRSDDIRTELESISTAVANLPSEMPFTVPEGYFERLPDQVLSLVQGNGAKRELEALSPLLAGLRETKPFSVPEGYFDSILPEQLIPQQREEDREAEADPAIIRKMPLRMLTMRLAAAASIIGLIALAAWLMTNRPNGAPDIETVQLATQLPNQPVHDTLAVSDEALAGFLLEDELMPGEAMLPDMDLPEAGDLAILDLNESRIQDLLSEIPDAVLETYVAQNPDSDGTINLN